MILGLAVEFRLAIQHPHTVMCDFELAIINSVRTHFGDAAVRLCLFHLHQIVYRKIQAEGLQQQYQDKEDASIRNASHMMCALAFVPPNDVPDLFDRLYNELPEEFLSVADAFELNYIRGRRAQGRRRAVKVKYAPAAWNQYNSVIQGYARTNNQSEGWHNRFQLLVGRNHPGIYAFIRELIKEQADIEYTLRDLSLGKKVKSLPKGRLQQREEKISAIVATYEEHRDAGTELEYLKLIGYYF